MSATDEDRAKAAALYESTLAAEHDEQVVDILAAALAAEREETRAPFLALADEYDRKHDETWRQIRSAISYDFDIIALQIRKAAQDQP